MLTAVLEIGAAVLCGIAVYRIFNLVNHQIASSAGLATIILAIVILRGLINER